MSAKLRIVEHKDCLRCFQPIDERAEMCPYCTSPQTKPRLHIGKIVAVVSLMLATLATYFWFSLDRERHASYELSNDLSVVQEKLTTSRSEAAEYLDATESLQRNRLGAAKEELTLLIERARTNTATASTFCDAESILGICSEVLSRTSKDTIALAELMGRFEALGLRGSFCDQMRPVLRELVRQSTNRLGADMHNSYYLATARCW